MSLIYKTALALLHNQDIIFGLFFFFFFISFQIFCLNEQPGAPFFALPSAESSKTEA